MQATGFVVTLGWYNSWNECHPTGLLVLLWWSGEDLFLPAIPVFYSNLILSFQFLSMPIDFLIYFDILIHFPTSLISFITPASGIWCKLLWEWVGNIINDVAHRDLQNHPLTLYCNRHLDSPIRVISLHISCCQGIPTFSLWMFM